MLIIIIISIIVFVFTFFAWANCKTKKYHANFTKNDVLKVIESVLANDCSDEWDMFLAWPINDTYLESIRKKCLILDEKYFGNNINVNGSLVEELKTIIEEINNNI